MTPMDEHNVPEWLRLSDEAFDAAWRDVLAAIRAEGRDPDAVVARAAAALDHYRAHPCDADEAVNWPATPVVTRCGVRGETFASPPFLFEEDL